MIDNYEQAITLTEKMKASLPIPIQVTPESAGSMKGKGNYVPRNHIFMIEEVVYSGDEGGILCVLQPEPQQKERYIFSLTHLRIGDDHPLAEEIKNYQRKRCMRLALADGKRGKATRLAKKTKKKKGFGTL